MGHCMGHCQSVAQRVTGREEQPKVGLRGVQIDWGGGAEGFYNSKALYSVRVVHPYIYNRAPNVLCKCRLLLNGYEKKKITLQQTQTTTRVTAMSTSSVTTHYLCWTSWLGTYRDEPRPSTEELSEPMDSARLSRSPSLKLTERGRRCGTSRRHRPSSGDGSSGDASKSILDASERAREAGRWWSSVQTARARCKARAAREGISTGSGGAPSEVSIVVGEGDVVGAERADAEGR